MHADIKNEVGRSRNFIRRQHLQTHKKEATRILAILKVVIVNNYLNSERKFWLRLIIFSGLCVDFLVQVDGCLPMEVEQFRKFHQQLQLQFVQLQKMRVL